MAGVEGITSSKSWCESRQWTVPPGMAEPRRAKQAEVATACVAGMYRSNQLQEVHNDSACYTGGIDAAAPTTPSRQVRSQQIHQPFSQKNGCQPSQYVAHPWQSNAVALFAADFVSWPPHTSSWTTGLRPWTHTLALVLKQRDAVVGRPTAGLQAVG